MSRTGVGLSRASMSFFACRQDVYGRDKPGHDERDSRVESELLQ